MVMAVWSGGAGRRADGNNRAPQPSRALPPAALAPALAELGRPVRYGDAEARPDGAFDQADLAAMGAHELGRDREPKARAAGPGRALERLEQMRAGLLRHAGAGIGDLDDHDRALAPAGDPDLVARRVVRRARLQRP